MGKIMMNGKQYGVGGITDASDVKYTDSQTVKGALDEVNAGLSALSDVKSVTAGTNITINNGGYVKAGKIVVVSLKLTTTAQLSTNAILVSGLPYTAQNVYVNCGNGYNSNAHSARTGQDKLYANGTIPNATELNIAVAYLSSY